MQKVLKTYLNRLVNLKSNNRSIFLNRLSKGQNADIHALDFVLNKPSFSIIEELLQQKNKISLCKNIDSRDALNNELSLQLKHLQRKNKQIQEERGVKDLFVGWPFVEGKLMDDSPIRCPLLLFPVELELSTDNTWQLIFRKNEGISFNKNFLLAYAYYNQTPIPDEILDETFEDFETDSTIFRTKLYQYLKDKNLEINFNQDLFLNKLSGFQDYKKSDFELNTDTGKLKLMPQAVLGIFPMHSSYLFPDYTDLIEQNHIESIENLFKSKNLELDKYVQQNLSGEQNLLNAFPIDAHQENILKKVKSGHSLVVQGPPGTGKSQLICNIITDFIANGKKVLVVCQKRAALDVVSQRLADKKIENFVSLIHDFQADRKDLYDKIDHQIQNVENYQLRNNKLDTVYQERRFKELSNSINSICSELDEFKIALFEISPLGKSIKELYLTTNRSLHFVDLKPQAEYFAYENKQKFIEKLKAYLLYAKEFDSEDFILRQRLSFKDFSINDLNRIIETIEDVERFTLHFKTELRKILVSDFELDEIIWINDRKHIFDQFFDFLKNDSVYSYFVQYTKNTTEKDRLYGLFDQIEALTKTGHYEHSLEQNELGEIQQLIQKSKSARANALKWTVWKLFSKDKYPLKRVLVANGLELDRASLQILEKKFDNRLNLEHHLTSVRSLNWVLDNPQFREADLLNAWIDNQKNALEAKEIFGSLRSLGEYFTLTTLNKDSLKEKVELLFKLLNEAVQKQQKWKKYLSEFQINAISKDSIYAQETFKALPEHFDALCEYDQTLASLNKSESATIDKLKEKDTSYDEVTWIDLFNNSLGLAWIEKIEEKNPILRKASTKYFAKLENELQSAIKEKRDISNEIMMIKAREHTYKNVEYNRLKNMTTYRELSNQVTKKRRIWPMRKLISEFEEELLDILPCWLCSPETVSAIFPLKPMFDVVIFDEASQCYSEKSIPAIFRGKQVLIVGDSKQLRPNDLYQVRYEEENTEDLSELEAESVLDLASFYLQSASLKQHYRSKSLHLIDFSNRNFYRSELQLIPDFKDINTKENGIEYIKVNGTWEKNANIIEAEKVVEVIQNLLEQKIKNIGVVTFNFHQQQLILDTLEAAATKEGFIIPSELFVKNIENVQGDERDYIIFSTGYAKDLSGKLRMQFGSLNMINGENRLNVAVTRAKEKIIFVSSLHPDELKVEDVMHEGPKLLKDYLKYAWEVSAGRFEYKPFESEKLSSALSLKEKLLDQYHLSELPFADITVKNDSLYESLILTDDDIFYEAVNSKDAHAYYPIFLKNKHWKFTRMFSREWWLNTKKE